MNLLIMWSISLQDAHAHCASMNIQRRAAASPMTTAARQWTSARMAEETRANMSFWTGTFSKRVLSSVYVITAEYLAARHVAKAALGGEGNEQTPAGAFIKRIFKAGLWIWRVDWGKFRSDGARLARFWPLTGADWLYFCDSDSKAAPFIHNLSSAEPAVRISRRYTSYLIVLYSTQTCFHHFWTVIHQCCLILGYWQVIVHH